MSPLPSRRDPVRGRLRTRSLAAAAATVIGLAALGTMSAGAATTATTTTTKKAAVASSAATTSVTVAHEAASDTTWNESSVVAVSLADSGTKVASGVKVSGSTVTITSGGTYRVTGTLHNGQLVVDAKGAVVRLLLNGMSVTSSTSSALSVSNADKVILILEKGSTNSLTDAKTYVRASATDTEPDAALFSKDDLTITGEGALTVTGNLGDGIASKDGLLISGGTITVKAADDAIRGKDYLVVRGGTLRLDAAGDGLKSTEEQTTNAGVVAITGGTVTINSGKDGIDAAQTVKILGGSLTIHAGDDAVHADAKLEVRGGTVKITASYEGLESKVILISGGSVDLVSSDDGINVADGSGGDSGGFGGRPGGGGASVDGSLYLTMSGGTVTVDAAGDGFDVNGNATISGGTLIVNGPTENFNAALDVDGTFQISGGVLLGAGSAGMAVAPERTSKQTSVDIVFENVQAAGTVIQLRDASGKVVVTYQAKKAMQSFVFSSPAIKSGSSYTVHLGGKPTGSSIGGYYPSAGATVGSSNVGSITA